jgi:hypothetical protein
MIFTAAAAKKYAKEGRAILSQLEGDKAPFISRAAKKALGNFKTT